MIEDNTILDDHYRALLAPEIEELIDRSPAITNRKVPRALVQSAFGLNRVRHYAKTFDQILCVGHHEDPTFDVLIKDDWAINGIDASLGASLAEHVDHFPEARYHIVLSISVMEHVVEDLIFVQQAADCLQPGGYGILTFDFKEGWKPGHRLPPTCHRFYDRARLATIVTLLNHRGCILTRDPHWQDGLHDFEFDGLNYAFGTLIFNKI